MARTKIEALKVVTFEGSLHIDRAGLLKESLLNALKSAKKVLFNFTHITSIDLTAIQIIYSAQKYAQKQKREFLFTGTVQEYVMNILSLGGFARFYTTDARDLQDSFDNFGTMESEG